MIYPTVICVPFIVNELKYDPSEEITKQGSLKFIFYDDKYMTNIAQQSLPSMIILYSQHKYIICIGVNLYFDWDKNKSTSSHKF